MIDSDINYSWNTFWDGETVMHEDGWTVEIRVPFSSLRFQPVDGKTRMGLILMRSMAAKSETVTWPVLSPDYAFPYWKPSLCKLIEFEGLQPKNPVYVTPYVTAGMGQVNQLNEKKPDSLMILFMDGQGKVLTRELVLKQNKITMDQKPPFSTDGCPEVNPFCDTIKYPFQVTPGLIQ